MTDTAGTRTSDPLALLLSADDLDHYLRSLVAAALAAAPSAVRADLVLERAGRPTAAVSVSRPGDEGGADPTGSPHAALGGPADTATALTAAFTGADARGRVTLTPTPGRPLDPADRERLLRLVTRLPDMMALAQRLFDAQVLAQDLQAAMQSRSVIDQAIGMVMSSRNCSSEQAMKSLRTLSQHRNVKLRDLCSQLVGRLTGSPAPPPLCPRP
ncbi:ANTAR domain-containing protein [Streptomyces lonarensis]|uniref:ANTAR domain-containing protein n=1 Tax=Streptomyces lonarensis TaxID=700599 RepID=A0A7X6HYM5_9ACTN|nr:ANTAR domain-containing protein [Streptomyces lonarensis]NJQ05580.1 ANTAR domain-containing protein [Streptomyces lonarensis]